MIKDEIIMRKELLDDAVKISNRYNGAPVVIVVAGSKDAGVGRCITEAKFPGEGFRLRDLTGVLQTSIQIETLRHFKLLK